jgi:hypothetical protein
MNTVQIFNDMISRGQKKIRKVPFKEHELRKATKPPASKRSNIARKFGMSKKDDLKPNPSTFAEKFSQILSRISSLAGSLAHVLLELQNVVSLSDEQHLHLFIRIDALDLGSREGISSDISNFWRNRGKNYEKASKLMEEFEHYEVLQRSCQQMLKDKKG